MTLDKTGQRTALRDPRGNQTTYDYDLLGRRTELTNPLSKTWQTAYEEVSGTLRTTLTNPLSQAVQRDTDRLGRLSGISYLSEDPKVTPDVSFAYDRAGNRTLMSETVDGGSSYERHTHFHYDDARRLTEVEFDTDGDDTVDETVEYAYEVGGRRTKLVLPDGKVIQYRYDERGQLVGLTDWDDQRARFAYDLAGRLIGIERSNDLRSRYAYDAAGRLQLLRHSYQHNTLLAEFDYTVDLLGNRTQVTETLRQPNDTLITKTIDYGYDGLSRLLSADYSTGETYAYEYDLAGNRTKKTVDETPTNYTYNAANQITSGGITYDDAGRMTSDGTNSLTWDRADRLLAYNGVENLYNGLGQRVSQTVSSIVTEYLLDLQPGLAVVLREQTGSNDPIHFLHGPRGLHAHNDGTTEANWRWPLLDGLGSVRGQVDAGLVDDVGEYDVHGVRDLTPYGDDLASAGVFGSSYHFTGEPRDVNGLVYLRARYLNPALGVFPSLDPFEGVIQRAMSLNGYSWVEGQVINTTDASGLCPSGQNIEAKECFQLRNELRRWGVNVVYDSSAEQTLGCLPDEVQEAANQAQSVRQRWTLSEMEAVYNAFLVYRGAYENLNLAQAGIPFPISPVVTVEKRRIASDVVNEAGIAGLNDTQLRALGIHVYPSERDARRAIILSATRWGTATDIVNMNQQRRSWLVLHEFSHILGKDRTPDEFGDAVELYQTRILRDLLFGTEETTAPFSGRLFNPTAYAQTSGLPSEFIIEALTGALWNFGFSWVSGYEQNAGGRTAYTDQQLNNEYLQTSQVFGSNDEGIIVANVRCITSPLGQTLEDWALGNVLGIVPLQQEETDCVRY